MDGSTLDALVRQLARQTTRRGAAKAALGALVLGAGWHRLRRDAAAQAQPGAAASCQTDQDCVGLAIDPCTSAGCIAGSCAVVHVDCIDGYVCCGGACCVVGATGPAAARTTAPTRVRPTPLTARPARMPV